MQTSKSGDGQTVTLLLEHGMASNERTGLPSKVVVGATGWDR
jgi:hypothetical protein